MTYQLCPKCNGQGTVSKPPYVAGDVHQWSSTACSFTCDVCNGAKIIATPEPNQPHLNYGGIVGYAEKMELPTDFPL